MKILLLVSFLLATPALAQDQADNIYNRLKAIWEKASALPLETLSGKTHFSGITVYFTAKNTVTKSVLALYDDSDPLIGNIIYGKMYNTTDPKLAYNRLADTVGSISNHLSFLQIDESRSSLYDTDTYMYSSGCRYRSEYRLVDSKNGPQFVIARLVITDEDDSCNTFTDPADMTRLFSYYRNLHRR